MLLILQLKIFNLTALKVEIELGYEKRDDS